VEEEGGRGKRGRGTGQDRCNKQQPQTIIVGGEDEVTEEEISPRGKFHYGFFLCFSVLNIDQIGFNPSLFSAVPYETVF
jgi:hypothetical protein